MALAAGTHLGPYEILSLLGVGGMGEVYKAVDHRLSRAVSIKVLPPQFSQDSEMKQRFEREAQTIASLNHPNICTLFDVGHQEGMDYLVLEYLEGETLAQRLERGPLPAEQALRISIEIADALDKAHREGVIHRDVKPSNIMLSKAGTKLLDFGLAKLRAFPAPGTVSSLPTRADVTAEGTILGTTQYMAPEQLEGKEADARTDIFALGATIYEMVTGKKAFEGKSQASLIAAIMNVEPDPPSAIQEATPPALDHIIKTCLAKDPERRRQSMRDVLTDLQWTLESRSRIGLLAPAALPGTRNRTGILIGVWAALATVLVVALAAMLLFRAPALKKASEIRFTVPVPVMPNSWRMVISPDGQTIAYMASTAARPEQANASMYIRPIGSVTPQEIPGTVGATGLFWSHDSQSLGFFQNDRLRKLNLSDRRPQTICDAPFEQNGTWNSADVIVFGNGRSGLRRVNASPGSVPVEITTLDASLQETAHEQPSFLPDGQHFLYVAWSGQPQNRALYVGSLDSKERTRLFTTESKALYADPGYLLFAHDGTLFAQPFDAAKRILSEHPIRVADEIQYNENTAAAAFSVSQSGTLIFRTGTDQVINRQLVSVDRHGNEERIGEAAPYLNSLELSPDGRQVSLLKRDARTKIVDVWLLDLKTRTPSQLTFGASAADRTWSRDSRQIAFASNKNGSPDFFLKNASGIGEETPLPTPPGRKAVEDWSKKDDEYIAYSFLDKSWDIYVLPLFGDRKAIPLVQLPGNQREPHFSYDSTRLAYHSSESNTYQVFVISFPNRDQRRQVSRDGGVQPQWKGDGKELYFLALDGMLMAVDMVAGARIDSLDPHPLFDTRLEVISGDMQYAARADGQSFFILKSVTTGATPAPITVVVNWATALKK